MVAHRPSGMAAELIKKWEGLKLESYQDIGGVWTIGYGETGKHIGPGLRITRIEAENWLKNRIDELGDQILARVKVPLAQHELDALVSFVYNVGIGAFSHSTLLRLLNQDKRFDAADELLRWDHVRGQKVAGLTNRRTDEWRHFRGV